MKVKALSLVMICLGLIGAAVIADADSRSLGAAEMRGRSLYYTARSQGGAPMSAFLGRSDMTASAKGVFCVSCHGFSGLGERETGISAGIITWDALSKPLSQTQGSVRQRPAYTPAAIKRLLLEGRDSSGKQIDATMPLYSLSESELDDLIAFLKVIGSVDDPGITDASIRIGTIIPQKGVHAGSGRIIEATLRAAIDDLNRSGGIYSRRIELVVADSGEDVPASEAAVRKLIEGDRVFALLSPYVPSGQGALLNADLKMAVPVIGPFAVSPEAPEEAMRYTFRTLSGAGEQAAALLEFARLREPGAASSLIIVSDASSGFGPLAQVAARFARLRLTERPVLQLPFPGDGMKRFAGEQKGRTRAVLYLGSPQQLVAFLEAASSENWYPFIYVPGQLAAREVLAAPAGFGGKIFLAYPTLPSDIQPQGWAELVKNAERSGGTAGSVPQIAALSSFRLLVQGLQQSGRGVSREQLVLTLEGLNRFDTALIPPLSFSTKRRVGANGAYIVGVDVEKKTLQVGASWVELP